MATSFSLLFFRWWWHRRYGHGKNKIALSRMTSSSPSSSPSLLPSMGQRRGPNGAATETIETVGRFRPSMALRLIAPSCWTWQLDSIDVHKQYQREKKNQCLIVVKYITTEETIISLTFRSNTGCLTSQTQHDGNVKASRTILLSRRAARWLSIIKRKTNMENRNQWKDRKGSRQTLVFFSFFSSLLLEQSCRIIYSFSTIFGTIALTVWRIFVYRWLWNRPGNYRRNHTLRSDSWIRNETTKLLELVSLKIDIVWNSCLIPASFILENNKCKYL